MAHKSTACRICGNIADNQLHVACEMMQGTRAAFDYLECSRCGCLQILAPPADMTAYYSGSYYSFAAPPGWKLWLKQQRAAAARGMAAPIGRLLLGGFGRPDYVDWLRTARVPAGGSILDVGCGSGALVRELAGGDFAKLVGIDPYTQDWASHDRRVRIERMSPMAVQEKFDLIMLHHSFEHMLEQREVLLHLSGCLNKGGVMLIRVPLASGAAWREYGVNWVQLDAPRHFYLHTAASLQHLFDAAGLRVDKIVYDSGPMQFWGSELYKRGIALTDPRSPWVNKASKEFTRQEMRDFVDRARQLNASGDGDQAAFYVRLAD